MPRKKETAVSRPRRPSAKAPSRSGGGDRQCAPLDWTTETSLEHWFPDAATRAALSELGKAAARAKTEPQKKKAWAQVAALFPPELAQLIGRAPWRWGAVPSPQVAAEAMRLIATAPHAKTADDIAMIERDLERILPELPALCLPEVVGEDVYNDAWEAIDTAIESESAPDITSALCDLREYLSTT